MVNYSFYPFLQGAKRDIKEFDIQSILYTQDNIEKYTPTNNLDIDIPVWLISTIILRNLNNNFLIRKFVDNYSKLAESHFLKDIDNKTVREELFQYFGIINKDISFITLRTVPFVKIHITDYLELETLTSEKHFKLVNQVLEKGNVIIEKKRFVYLMRLVLERKLFEKIKAMKEYNKDERINEVVNKLRDIYPITQKRVQVDSVPESIKELIQKAYDTHHLSHLERIKIGITLQGRGVDIEEIVDIFRQCSDFNEKTTRYQLNSLKKYIKP